MMNDLLSLTMNELTQIVRGTVMNDTMENAQATWSLNGINAKSRKSLIYTASAFVEQANPGIYLMGLSGLSLARQPFFYGWCDFRVSPAAVITAGDTSELRCYVQNGPTPIVNRNNVWSQRWRIPSAFNAPFPSVSPVEPMLFQSVEFQWLTGGTAYHEIDFAFRGIQIDCEGYGN